MSASGENGEIVTEKLEELSPQDDMDVNKMGDEVEDISQLDDVNEMGDKVEEIGHPDDVNVNKMGDEVEDISQQDNINKMDDKVEEIGHPDDVNVNKMGDEVEDEVEDISQQDDVNEMGDKVSGKILINLNDRSNNEGNLIDLDVIKDEPVTDVNIEGLDNIKIGDKEIIELDLGVTSQMSEYDNELTDSEGGKQDKLIDDVVEEEQSESAELSYISVGYSNKDAKCVETQKQTSIDESSGSTQDLEKRKSEETENKKVTDSDNMGDEDITVTEEILPDRRDQEVQSSFSDIYGDIHDYSYEDFYHKDSMINALFNKSPVHHDDAESSEIQVTIFLPTNQSITKNYQANTNVIELKKDIGDLLNYDPNKLQISLIGDSKGDYIGDWTPLLGIPPNSVGGLILNLTFKYDVTLKNNIEFPSVQTYAPIITVRRVPVEDGLGRAKIVTVVTEDISYVKEWLGGFRNTNTGQMYHNASTATNFWDRKPKKENPIDQNSRDAQTHLPYLTKYTQVSANKTTQMWRPDHYITNTTDKIITARPYIEFDLQNEQQQRVEVAIKIQRWFRRQQTRQNVRKAFSKLIDLIRKQREKRSAAEAAVTRERIMYIVGVSYPTTRNDFFNLYSIIGLWWKKEYNLISKIESVSEKRAALYDLLQDEIDLLAAIEKQRIKSKKESLRRKNMKLLEETSRPIVRHQRKFASMTIVETLEVQRAREIKEIYTTYTRKDLDKKERIQVLLSLINLLESFEEIDYTRDLIMLMRREVDMMTMGIDSTYLQGLRKRIEEGIMHFVRDEQFNPQVKNVRPIHYPRVDQRSYRCIGCRKLKNPADFLVHVRLTSFVNCKSCEWIHHISHSEINIAPYASILKLLRAREIVKCPRSTYCFLVQPFGTYFIVNTLWNGKSAISESTNIKELRLCRWDNKEEWTPWNTILLTVDEAEIHERILNNEDVYEPEFIQSVKLKHITAKFHFKVMDESDTYCRETGLWDTAFDENIYQHMFRRRQALQFKPPIFNSPPPKYFLKANQYKNLDCVPSRETLYNSAKYIK